MCGIAGVYRPQRAMRGVTEMSTVVGEMTKRLVHRGPDAGGIWSDTEGRCVLGHRRLSIIDTSDAGVQPMVSGNGRWIITFNGEVYNFLEIKAELERAGVTFTGRTDTEVLVEAVAHWGVNALHRLDGMFAFAAFDTHSGELLVARDAFGEKPLYVSTLRDGTIAFASELQALESAPGFDPTIDLNAMAEVLTFQYIGAPRSIYRSVEKLRPGHWVRIDRIGRFRSGRYFQFRPGWAECDPRPLPDLADELEDILVRSIARRMVADVPLGAFLSGGVDSSTVCALIRRRLGLPLKTFSIGFDGAPESEHFVARQFAAHLGTEHHDQIVAPDASAFLQRIGAVLDEPNADSSCLPTYLLSEMARSHVTVAVSGDGGDEMFAGYSRYGETLAERDAQARGELQGWLPGDVYYRDRVLVSAEPQISALFGLVPKGFQHHLSALRGKVNGERQRLLSELRETDVENYMPGAVLPKVDRMSMQHSLEVRTPFLNIELARFAERLPDSAQIGNGRSKLILREIAYRYLPRDLVNLPKQGFALPLSDWARESLLSTATNLLMSDDSRLMACFGPERIRAYVQGQRAPGSFSAYGIWGVAMLESWLRHHPAKLPDLSPAIFEAQCA